MTGGHVTILRTCYRTTRAIIEAAKPLIANQHERLGEDLVLPDSGVPEDGPAPRLILADSPESEKDCVVEEIWNELAAGSPPETIAVFADDGRFLREVAAGLAEYDVPYELFLKPDGSKALDVTHPSVKLITTYSAKGIEFPIVFICRVTEGRFPTRGDRDRCDRARRKLYTAMLRAAWKLTLTATRRDASRLLQEIGILAGSQVAAATAPSLGRPGIS